MRVLDVVRGGKEGPTLSEERQQRDLLDARLVEDCLAGVPDAFEKLVTAKRTLVFRTACHQLGNEDDARVVAQAVFVRLWKNLDRFDPKRRFDTWLYRLTVNASIDHHRRRKVRGTEVELSDCFELPAAPAACATSEGQVELQEIRRILAELSDELTEKQKAAFLLREVEGLPTSDVARTLGSTESTVRNHVFQARKILQRALMERYPEYCPQWDGGRDHTSEEREPS